MKNEGLLLLTWLMKMQIKLLFLLTDIFFTLQDNWYFFGVPQHIISHK